MITLSRELKMDTISPHCFFAFPLGSPTLKQGEESLTSPAGAEIGSDSVSGMTSTNYSPLVAHPAGENITSVGSTTAQQITGQSDLPMASNQSLDDAALPVHKDYFYESVALGLVSGGLVFISAFFNHPIYVPFSFAMITLSCGLYTLVCTRSIKR
jgi:hypothetical protein